jgi:hypothetical protein
MLMKHRKSTKRKPAAGIRTAESAPVEPKALQFKDHLLNMPRDGGSFERMAVSFREPDLFSTAKRRGGKRQPK